MKIHELNQIIDLIKEHGVFCYVNLDDEDKDIYTDRKFINQLKTIEEINVQTYGVELSAHRFYLGSLSDGTYYFLLHPHDYIQERQINVFHSKDTTKIAKKIEEWMDMIKLFTYDPM